MELIRANEHGNRYPVVGCGIENIKMAQKRKKKSEGVQNEFQ